MHPRIKLTGFIQKDVDPLVKYPDMDDIDLFLQECREFYLFYLDRLEDEGEV